MVAVVFSHNGGIPVGGSFIAPYYIALFFIISGYFYKENCNYLYRAKTLIAKYAKYSFVLFGISLIRHKSPWVINLIGIFYGRYCLLEYNNTDNIVFMNMENHPLWFLCAMAVTVILSGILILKLKSLISVIVAFMLLAVTAYILSFLPVLLPWSLDTAPILSVFMICGFYLKKYDIFDSFDRSRIKIPLFVFVAIIYFILKKVNRGINIAVRLYGGNERFCNVVMYICIGIIGSFLCIVFCKIIKSSLIGKLFSIVGKHTIPVMGLHVLFYQLILSSVNLSQGNVGYWYILINIIIIIVCIIIDILIKKFISKN